MAVIRVLMDILRLVLTVTRPYSYTFLDFVYRIIFGAKQELPAIEDNILLISATELAQKIRKRQLRSEDVIKTYIKRIKAVDPFINACVDERFEAAEKEGREVDKFLSTTSKSEEEIEKETPLLGVPFTCKEPVGVKGLAQTCGIYAAKDRKAEDDSVCVLLCRKSGAVPVAVTNVPLLCMWWDSENIPFGRTVNPYDSRRSAGGSSGGEAAVLASAGSVIGIGNDIGGSIRMPAAFNGIYGFKPSPGMISNEGYWPEDDAEIAEEIDKIVGTGPMCRYAQDLPLLAKIMSEERVNFAKRVDFQKLKIYYMDEFPGLLFQPEVEIKVAVRKATEYFKQEYGNRPTKVMFPELRRAHEIWETKLQEAGLPLLRDFIAGPENKVNLFIEFMKWIFGYSEHTLQIIYFASIQRQEKDANYYKYLAMYRNLKKNLDELLTEDALLIIPTHPEPAPHHLMTIPKFPNIAYTSIFNILGYPSTQIPAGDINGLPVGIQAISAVNKDYITLSAAIELDKVFGGWKSPSKILKV